MDQKQIQDKLERIQREVNQVIRGKENVVERVLAAIISGGHILMEDIPGVGKTTLATTLKAFNTGICAIFNTSSSIFPCICI